MNKKVESGYFSAFRFIFLLTISFFHGIISYQFGRHEGFEPKNQGESKMLQEKAIVTVNLTQDGKTVTIEEAYQKPSVDNSIEDLKAGLNLTDKEIVKFFVHGYDLAVLRPKIRRVVEAREGGDEKIIAKFVKNFVAMGLDEATARTMAEKSVQAAKAAK